MGYFIDVFLPLPLSNSFTYAVSQKEFAFLSKGFRVAVPFGNSKIYTGIINKKHRIAPLSYVVKEIDCILDKGPVVTSEQLVFWKWMADYYMCSMGAIIKACLPSIFLLESETIIVQKEVLSENLDRLSDEKYLIYEALGRGSLSIKQIQQLVDKKMVMPLLQKMLSENSISIKQKITDKYFPKKVGFIALSREYSDSESIEGLLKNLERSPQQKKLFLSYFNEVAKRNPPIEVSFLLKKYGMDRSILKSLLKKNVFIESFKQKDRVDYSVPPGIQKTILTVSQKKALGDIVQKLSENRVVFLHGITSSGKTELYIQLIAREIKQKKQVLFLVPEISLTPQIMRRLQEYFGDMIRLFHSKFSIQERAEVWKNILKKSDRSQIIIGTRSALFLPFQELGLIIVDEEHETSYKQIKAPPHYNARDCAIMLSRISRCPILLGSATPSIETFFNCKKNKFAKVSLTERFGGVLPPEIKCIDMKVAYKKKQMKGAFSMELLVAMDTVLKDDKQVILFQNRRGYSPVVLCNVCGHIPQCKNCDVTLTYHQTTNKLQCHYCNYFITRPVRCIHCNSPDMNFKGIGTQQIDEQAQSFFPDYVIKRMDGDSTQKKGSFDRIISAFSNKEIHILIGTQMITKGLDFSNVALVGVINTDYLINVPNFRAYEHSFQTLLQVAGRAGRRTRGIVFLQTFQPFHPLLQQIMDSDFKKMYATQIIERKEFHYPPFFRLIKFTLKHRSAFEVKNAAEWLAQGFKNNCSVTILGPTDPLIPRIKNQYLKQILVKIDSQKKLSSSKQRLQKILDSFFAVPKFRKIKITVDVDPI